MCYPAPPPPNRSSFAAAAPLPDAAATDLRCSAPRTWGWAAPVLMAAAVMAGVTTGAAVSPTMAGVAMWG
jgi:hypothetical protein